MVDYVGEVSKITSSIYDFLGYILLAVVIIGVVAVIVIILQYKHRVRVRCVIGGKTIIIDDRAKEIKDNEGVTKWKLFKRKHCLPPPPSKAIHITNKGKYSVEAYYLPEGEYKYVKDKGVERRELIGKKGEYCYVIDNGVNLEELTHFEPLDTSDREFYASEMKEAESYKQKKWTEYILPIAGVVSIMMVFILMLVFWEDIAKPGITITQTASGIAEQQYKTTEILRDMIQNRQTIPYTGYINSSNGG